MKLKGFGFGSLYFRMSGLWSQRFQFFMLFLFMLEISDREDVLFVCMFPYIPMFFAISLNFSFQDGRSLVPCCCGIIGLRCYWAGLLEPVWRCFWCCLAPCTSTSFKEAWRFQGGRTTCWDVLFFQCFFGVTILKSRTVRGSGSLPSRFILTTTCGKWINHHATKTTTHLKDTVLQWSREPCDSSCWAADVVHRVDCPCVLGLASSCSANHWAQLDATAGLWNLKPITWECKPALGIQDTMFYVCLFAQSTIESLKPNYWNIDWKTCLILYQNCSHINFTIFDGWLPMFHGPWFLSFLFRCLRVSLSELVQ